MFFDSKINLNLIYLDTATSQEREDDGIYMNDGKIDHIDLPEDIRKDILADIDSKYNIISGNDCPMGRRRNLAEIIICLKNNAFVLVDHNSKPKIKIEGNLVKFNFPLHYCGINYNYIYTAKMKGNPTIILD